jgi:hypothetical protein
MAFKPEMLAPASLQLVAPNAKRQPKRVAGADGSAASASVQFEPHGLPMRSNAQLQGAFTNRALSPNKLCFTVRYRLHARSSPGSAAADSRTPQYNQQQQQMQWYLPTD